MSYLDRLKRKILEDAPKSGATEVSKGATVPFVATPPAPLRQISLGNDDAPDVAGTVTDTVAEAWRCRVVAMLRNHSTMRYAAVTDTESDPDAVIVALAIRGRASCELLVPRAKWDGVLFLDLLNKHCDAIH